jgi:hypothetical protein
MTRREAIRLLAKWRDEDGYVPMGTNTMCGFLDVLCAPLTVADCLEMPEVRAVVEALELAYSRLDRGREDAWTDGDEMAIRHALTPFRATP